MGRTIRLRAVVNDPPPGNPPEGAVAFFYDGFAKADYGAAPLNGNWVAQLPVTAQRYMNGFDSGVCDDSVGPYSSTPPPVSR